MKKLRLIYLTGVFTFGALSIFALLFSCKKDTKTSNEPGGPLSLVNSSQVKAREISELELPENATEEMTRVFNDIQDAEYVIAVTANPNYGYYSSSCLSATYLNGAVSPTDAISITLGENTYYPDEDGQFLVYDNLFSGMYDSDVDVEIKSGSTVLKNATMHVPQICKVNKLDSNFVISRTGTTLTWNADQGNILGYVILYFTLFDENGDVILTDGELLDDDGSFSLDAIISDTDVKAISFQMITGNTTSSTVGGQKLLFLFESMDHHSYSIN